MEKFETVTEIWDFYENFSLEELKQKEEELNDKIVNMMELDPSVIPQLEVVKILIGRKEHGEN